ncbi:MAG: carbon storage regulator [Xanthomonadales bacterium]|jgi:carbon storage regulator|nr:carbon storage regulator [Xanthomonadales bacterium]
MLVLTRSEGQSILIGDGVKVTVVSTKGGQVRFAIDAPRDVTILREELGKRNARKDPAWSRPGRSSQTFFGFASVRLSFANPGIRSGYRASERTLAAR